jgi:hypothetical protein
MHAGFSFSYSPISVLLRQPLSIKKSYAGAVQLYMYVAGICLLFYLLFYLVVVLYNTCTGLQCVLGLISVMLITPDVFVGGFPAVPPKSIKNPAEKAGKNGCCPFCPGKNTHILLACSVSICTVVDTVL